MKAAWLDSVPYGGYQKGRGGAPWTAGGASSVGAYPSAYDESTTTFILLGGLVLITGGGAALGWFLGGTKMSAVLGALGGLSYSAVNLAINASAMAAELGQAQPPQQIPAAPPIQSSALPPGVHTGYPTGPGGHP